MTLDFAQELDFSEILTNPILDIAARFWEADRYNAFRACYRSMRRIDDFVDDRKAASGHISQTESARLRKTIFGWLESVRCPPGNDQFQRKFLTILDRFAIPFWPWEKLCRAMVYDLEHNGYRNFRVFLRYAEGAAVAPASVFMHLCGVRDVNGRYSLPSYEIRRAARSLALFSYLVHIIRDVRKDQLQNLNYFSDDLLTEQSLSVFDLHAMAKGGRIGQPFRRLMQRYVGLAEYYRKNARRTIDTISPALESRYQLSLEIVYQLYLQIFKRIDPVNGHFTAEELNPSPEQVQALIEHVTSTFVPLMEP